MKRLSSSQPVSKKSRTAGCSLNQPTRTLRQNTTADYSEDKSNYELKISSSKLVKLFLTYVDNTRLLKRQTIRSYITTKSKGVSLNKIIDTAIEELKNTYGIICECIDSYNATPSYVFKKITPHINIPDDNTCNAKQTMHMLILTLVFMSGEKCSYETVHKFLEQLQYKNDDIERQLKEMGKLKFLIINEEEIAWGPHADAVIDKMELLKSFSKLYNNEPTMWRDAYKKAVEQINDRAHE